MAGSRILAHGITEKLRARVTAALSGEGGPGDGSQTPMGPVIDRAHVLRVDRLVADAEEYGKVLLVRRTGLPGRDGGIPAPVPGRGRRAVPLVQRELSGPVATLEVLDDEADAML
ncbi:aldehyde dehydrogenase family protein [Streptomyces sp. NPDC051636]|uniref:aldehyde dehydrogenase family protein n=1 Tax=Streptomyces sp. NPDC051636 TaxID=3365663 RepID=UPI0037ACBBB5